MFLARIIGFIFVIVSIGISSVNGHGTSVRGHRALKGNGDGTSVRGMRDQKGKRKDKGKGKNKQGMPDGLPPSLETICDQYNDNDKAKGLCTAFCEAQDCDNLMGGDVSTKKSCASLKKNFAEITGQDSFPCEMRCPCWTTTELDGFFGDSNLDPVSCIDQSPGETSLVFLLSSDEEYFAYATDALQADFNNGNHGCLTWTDGGETSMLMDISASEAKLCVESVVEHCAKIGLPVGDF